MNSRLYQIGEGMHLDDTKTTRQKEKKRTECINKAFSDLRKCIPNVPPDTKLSKIKTLRLASSYIGYLSDILENSEPGDPRNGKEFHADYKDLRSRDRKKYNLSKDDESKSKSNNNGVPVKKRKKGRTGWPEAVWAEALETVDNNQQEKSKWGTEKANTFVDTSISYVAPTNNIAQPMPYVQLVRKAKFISEFEVVLNQYNPMVQNPNVLIDNTPLHSYDEENQDILEYNNNNQAFGLRQPNTGAIIYQHDQFPDMQAHQIMAQNNAYQTLPSISTMSYGEKIIIDPLRPSEDIGLQQISYFNDGLSKQGEPVCNDLPDAQNSPRDLIELQPVIFQTPS